MFFEPFNNECRMQLKVLLPGNWLGLIQLTTLDFLSKHCRYVLLLKLQDEFSMKHFEGFFNNFFSAESFNGCLQWSTANGLLMIYKPAKLFIYLRNIIESSKTVRGLQVNMKKCSLLGGGDLEALGSFEDATTRDEAFKTKWIQSLQLVISKQQFKITILKREGI